MDNEPKLDWMYAGAAGHVNTDEYLTGRAVDKTFEQFKLGGAEPVGLDLPAPVLPRQKQSVPTYQVDVARKVSEDPLLKIKHQEEERRAMLREQMLIQQRLCPPSKKLPHGAQERQNDPEVSKGKSHKPRRKRKPSESSLSSEDLDSKLASKLKQLKKPNKKEDLDQLIAGKLKKLKELKHQSKPSSSSEDEGGQSYKRRSHSEKETDRRSTYEPVHRKDSKSSGRYHRRDERNQTHFRDRYRKSRSRSRSRDRNLRHQDARTVPPHRPGGASSHKRPPSKLSDDEIEKRRMEMMQQAVVRDQERKDKVEKYRKEVQDEDGQLNADRPKEAAFVKYLRLAKLEETTSYRHSEFHRRIQDQIECLQHPAISKLNGF